MIICLENTLNIQTVCSQTCAAQETQKEIRSALINFDNKTNSMSENEIK